MKTLQGMFLNVRIVRILYIVSEKRRVPLVVLELLILPEHASSRAGINEVRVAQLLVFRVVICRSLIFPFCLCFLLVVVLSVLRQFEA